MDEQTVTWIENLLKVSLEASTYSILSTILLSSFIHNLDDGPECKFSKTAQKIRGVDDTPHMLVLHP